MFDIKDFYPSISKEPLIDALTFAKTKINLDDHDKNYIPRPYTVTFQSRTNVDEKRK